MIIVIARAEFDPVRLDELQPAFNAMMRAAWEETGCLSYSMAVESRADGIVTTVVRWASEADLAAHANGRAMAAFKTAIGGDVRSIDARRYDVTDDRPLLF